jgi:two-component system, LytTR family, response regulator
MNQPLIINQTDVIHVIKPSEILYCTADRGYSTLYLVNGQNVVNTKTLASLCTQLNRNFIRISQSTVVNRLYIRRILKKEKCIELENGLQLPFTLKISELEKIFQIENAS